MKRVDKINYYLDIAQTVAARGTCLRRNFGAIMSRTTRSSPPAMSAHPEADRTAVTWATAPAKSSTFPEGSGMSCAARYTQKPTPSSAHPARR